MYETYPQGRLAASESKTDLLTRICGHPPRFSPEQQLLNWLMAVIVALVLLYAVENAAIGVALVGPDVAGALFFFGLYCLGRFQRVPISVLAPVAFGSIVLLHTLAWLENAGVDGSTLFLYLATLVGITGVFRGRQRLAWACIVAAHLAAMLALQSLHPDWITAYNSPRIQRFDVVFTFSTVAVFLMGFVAVSMHNLDERRKVADALLLNILPEVIADKLKYSPGRIVADHHREASILFADIVGFTPLSAGLAPIDLVQLLNSAFSYFDTLVDKYGLEKIKTIGDCYMVAAGVPEARADHAATLTRMALEMRDYVCTHDFEGKRLSLRIGINSGPVVAGVIGYRKFAYDLWGDAVNTASRMESHGQPDIIQITSSTYDLIKDSFQCESQGCIEVKGKGTTEVWHVLAPRASPG